MLRTAINVPLIGFDLTRFLALKRDADFRLAGLGAFHKTIDPYGAAWRQSWIIGA